VPQNQHAKVSFLAVAQQYNGGGVSAERNHGELSSDGLFVFFGGSENHFCDTEILFVRL
jgi:hypothetical protein